MSRTHRMVLTVAFALPLAAAAGQVSAAGGAQADTPARMSEGELGAYLVLTGQPDALFERWQEPRSDITVDVADEVARGESLTALVLFKGCGADTAGNCDLAVKYRILEPDGDVYADLPFQEVWVGRPALAEGRIGLGVSHIEITIEPEDPLGRYTVEATVRDRIRGETLDLRAQFEAVETSSASEDNGSDD